MASGGNKNNVPAIKGRVDPLSIRYRWVRHSAEEVAAWKKLRDPSYWKSQLELRKSGNSEDGNKSILPSSTTEGGKVNDTVSDTLGKEESVSVHVGGQLAGEGEKSITFEIPSPPEGSSKAAYGLMISPTSNGPFMATWVKKPNPEFQQGVTAAAVAVPEGNDNETSKDKVAGTRGSPPTTGTGNEYDISDLDDEDDDEEDEDEDQTEIDNDAEAKKRKFSELFLAVLQPPPSQRGSTKKEFEERVNKLKEKMDKLQRDLDKAVSRKQRELEMED